MQNIISKKIFFSFVFMKIASNIIDISYMFMCFIISISILNFNEISELIILFIVKFPYKMIK